MRSRVVVLTLAATAALGALVAAPAVADDGPVLVADEDTVTLVRADDGSASAAVTLQNQADTDLSIGAEPAGTAAEGCSIDPADGASLRAHRQQEVTLTFSAACRPDRAEGTDFTVTAGDATFDLHAKPASPASPPWRMLAWLYAVALVVSAACTWLVWATWKLAHTATPPPHGWRERLPGLTSTWKFTDSWATNVTAVTALFTGLFGAQDVVTSIVGDGTKTLLPLTLVAGALSIGLAGLSPMLLQAWRERLDDPSSVYLYTVRGLLAAGALTLTAALGQLFTVLYAVYHAGYWDWWVPWVGGIAVAVVVLWYAWRTLMQTLDVGFATPTPDRDAPEFAPRIQPRTALL